MPRLTISLSNTTHKQLSILATHDNESLSNVINRLILLGMRYLNVEDFASKPPVEKHCQQLIIQMNALIKNLSAEVLKFSQEDFEQLRQATIAKYNELI